MTPTEVCTDGSELGVSLEAILSVHAERKPITRHIPILHNVEKDNFFIKIRIRFRGFVP